MPLGALVARKAVTVEPQESLSKATRLMEQENVGAVVVVERERPVNWDEVELEKPVGVELGLGGENIEKPLPLN